MFLKDKDFYNNFLEQHCNYIYIYIYIHLYVSHILLMFYNTTQKTKFLRKQVQIF